MLLDERTGLEILDRSECLRLLATQFIGRVGLVVSGRAVVLPVSYVLDRGSPDRDRPDRGSPDRGSVVFRTAVDSNFDRTVLGAEVAFEIDAADPAYHTGWSVLARGIAEEIRDAADLDRLARASLRPWARVDRPRWIRIPLGELTGRRIVQVTAGGTT